MWAKTKQIPGFTIVELLIVIVVIGILAAISIVAYSGVQQRATVASLQSDLTNASQLLKMFQVDNSAYPLTINCAIADSPTNKCIKSSSSTAYQYSYNNANSPSFCLMAQNGTTIYSVSNDSAPVRGVCLTNLVTNGDFSAGTNGWNSSGMPTVTTNASLGRTSLKFVATGNNPYYAVNIPSNQSHYWYTKLEYYVSSYTSGSISALDVRNSDSGGITTVSANLSKLNQWQSLSIITTAKTGGGEYILIGTGNAYATATFYISNVSSVDLTAAFGAGNEPTKAQMDTIMQQFPNNWFNGTALAGT